MHTNGARTALRRAVHVKLRVCAAVAYFALFSGCISPNPVPDGENSRAASGGATASSGGSTGGSSVTVPAAGSGAGTGGKSGGPTPECRSSLDCAPPTPYCMGGSCIECTSNGNCSGTGRRLCSANYTCVTCLNDAQCAAAEPYCAPDGNCVQCLSTRNCGASDATCDPVLHRCVSVCVSDGDCSVDAGRPFCNSKLGECVQCIADEDCPPIRAHCLLSAGTCEKCLADSDCTAPTPHCDAKSHACAECAKNADCRAGYFCQAGACTVIPE